MKECEYICTADCYELDCNNEPHCKCSNLESYYEEHPDCCWVGNQPKWEKIPETAE